MARIYKGGCLCGNIRFEAEGPPLKPHTCSCKMCQLHWVELQADKLRWTGPGGKPSIWRSSDYSSRSFCPACGSTLGAIDDKPAVALVLGSFDSANRQELAPDFHSYAGQRPKWMKAQGE